MNWYKRSQSNFAYHSTSANNVEAVLSQGLKINQPWGKSEGAKAIIEDIYGLKPIFISFFPDYLKKGSDVTFIIDVSGLPLVADAPSIYDNGAFYGEQGMWFEGNEPSELKDVIDKYGEIFYKDMLSPEHPVCQACIRLTNTAAIMQNIEPERISLQPATQSTQ